MTQEKGREPQLDRYPDGWGMKIDPTDEVSPDEAREIINGIIKQEEGEPDA